MFVAQLLVLVSIFIVQLFLFLADICETGSQAAQTLISMDSPSSSNDSRTLLNSAVTNGNTPTPQSKTGNLPLPTCFHSHLATA